MKWLIFLLLSKVLLLEAIASDPNNILGPRPREPEENLILPSEDLVKINITYGTYINTDPIFDTHWISLIGERYGFPMGMEIGKNFKVLDLSFNLNFLGYYNSYFGYPGHEYAWRGQFNFLLP